MVSVHVQYKIIYVLGENLFHTVCILEKLRKLKRTTQLYEKSMLLTFPLLLRSYLFAFTLYCNPIYQTVVILLQILKWKGWGWVFICTSTLYHGLAPVFSL